VHARLARVDAAARLSERAAGAHRRVVASVPEATVAKASNRGAGDDLSRVPPATDPDLGADLQLARPVQPAGGGAAQWSLSSSSPRRCATSATASSSAAPCPLRSGGW